jgi:Zn/Cd-binding protein ZinT
VGLPADLHTNARTIDYGKTKYIYIAQRRRNSQLYEGVTCLVYKRGNRGSKMHCSLFYLKRHKNKYRIFKPVEITTRRGLR